MAIASLVFPIGLKAFPNRIDSALSLSRKLDTLVGIVAVALIILAYKGVLQLDHKVLYALSAIGGCSLMPLVHSLILKVLGMKKTQDFLKSKKFISLALAGTALLALAILNGQGVISVKSAVAHGFVGTGSLLLSYYVMSKFERLVRLQEMKRLVEANLAAAEAADRASETATTPHANNTHPVIATRMPDADDDSDTDTGTSDIAVHLGDSHSDDSDDDCGTGK